MAEQNSNLLNNQSTDSCKSSIQDQCIRDISGIEASDLGDRVELQLFNCGINRSGTGTNQ